MILTLLQTGGSNWQGLLMMGGIFLVFYFFFIRPQQKKQKDTKLMQQTLKVGDKVVTSGGFHVTIISTEEATVVVELARGVNATIDRTSVFSAIVKS